MMKELLRRKDTRWEAYGVAAVFAIVVAIAASSRNGPPVAMAKPRPSVGLAVAQSGPWKIRLLRMEACPEREVATAVIEVSGASLPGSASPVSDVALAGLTPDGGFWIGSAPGARTVSYAGACGAVVLCQLSWGDSLAVLRFRGKASANAALSFSFFGRPVRFKPLTFEDSARRPAGLGGLVFGG